MRKLFLLIPFLLPWLISLISGQQFNLLYYSLVVLLVAFVFKLSLTIKGILLFGIATILGYELFSFIDFQINYWNDNVHFEGNEIFPTEMYRDYNSYIEFQYIENVPTKHVIRHIYLLGSVYLICFAVYFGRKFVRNRVKGKNYDILDQDY